jgi:hypothetical protein
MAESIAPVKKSEPAPTAAEIYKNWISDQPKLKAMFLEALAAFPIPHAQTRVENFLGQTGHEMKEAAHAEVFGVPSP